MERRAILAVVLGLWLPCVSLGAGPITRSDLPTRKSLELIGLEQNWFSAVPLDGIDQVLSIHLVEDFLFARTKSGHVHAFDAETGMLRWSVSLGYPTTLDLAPAVNSDMAFIPNGLQLFAFTRNTGILVWVKDLGNQAASGPSADEKRVVVGLLSGKIANFALNDTTGFRKNNTSTSAPEVKRAKNPRNAWAWKTGDAITSRPIITPKLMVFGSKDSRLYVGLNVEEDGNELRKPQFLYIFRTAGPISADLNTYGTRTILAPSEDQNLYALDLYDAHVKWVHTASGPIKQSPLVIRDQVVVVDDSGEISNLRASDGELLWKKIVRDSIFISSGKNRVYLFDSKRDLVILDHATGKTLLSGDTTRDRYGLNLRNFTIHTLNSVSDRIYLSTPNGFLICLREANQKEPYLLRDPSSPPFGYIPLSSGPLFDDLENPSGENSGIPDPIR